MALKITATTEKKILIKGTEVELQEIYARLEMVARADGKTMELYLSYYANKDQFKNNEPLAVDIPFKRITVKDMKDEVQSIDSAHTFAITALEEQSYKAVKI